MARFGWTQEDVYLAAARGYALYEQGRFDDAAVVFEGLVAIDPDDAYCRKALAALYLRLGEPGKAVRQLDAALLRHPGDEDALARRSEAFLEAGDLASARADLEALPERPRRLEMRLAAAIAARQRFARTSSQLARPLFDN